MEVKLLIAKYLQSARLMQLATVKDDQPWVCTVYFVADEDLNLYWLSWPERRHSQEALLHGKVAAAVVVHDGSDGKPVIGMQAEGVAAEVADEKVVKAIAKRYVQKYGRGTSFYKNFMAGTNRHRLYKLSPQMFVLFDEQHFSPNDSRQELLL